MGPCWTPCWRRKWESLPRNAVLCGSLRRAAPHYSQVMKYLYAVIALIGSLAVCGHFHAHWLVSGALLVLIFCATFRPSRQ